MKRGDVRCNNGNDHRLHIVGMIVNIDLIPQDQLNLVLSQDLCDIDCEFLGFTEIYEHLAKIIPCHWTVVDLGCAFAPQAFLFTNHKAYIGVDSFPGIKRFKAKNTTIYEMTIKEFVEKHLAEFDLDTTFAICSHVPPWGADNMKIAHNFKNIFTYYPSPSGRFPYSTKRT